MLSAKADKNSYTIVAILCVVCCNVSGWLWVVNKLVSCVKSSFTHFSLVDMCESGVYPACSADGRGYQIREISVCDV